MRHLFVSKISYEALQHDVLATRRAINARALPSPRRPSRFRFSRRRAISVAPCEVKFETANFPPQQPSVTYI